MGLSVGVLLAPVMHKTNKPALEPDQIIGTKFSILTVALICYVVFSGVIGYFKYYNYLTMTTAVVFLCSLFLVTLPIAPAEANGANEVSTTSAGAPQDYNGIDMLVKTMLQTVDF